ncbi:hypothetical protein HanIR_Chr06g0274191 [Helianthus annuus]|nr:hypothetical protein HanIR_Chr06g0274191 [Helianthus annuus]
MGCMPLSRSWKRADTSSNSLLRTSSPSRHPLAVRMINLSSSCFRSTSPLSPHLEKYSCMSQIII